jgi:ABC-type phosphate transport system substrate-binding protein
MTRPLIRPTARTARPEGIFVLRRLHRPLLSVTAALLALAGAAIPVTPAHAASGVIGAGSSFAGIELQEWSKDVAAPPYNLNVNYQSSSSGQGRSEFVDKTIDFAVTDIRFNSYDDTQIPDSSTFIYVPVTAGGVAFMYNLSKSGLGPGTPPIHLSSLTVCGIFTGAIPYWDDPAIKADNPGVNMPHVPVTPVIRSDPSGTNFVMEEYCIQLHNDLYSAFAAQASKLQSTDFPDTPTSHWPIVPPIIAASGSDNAAATVANPNANGEITAVETGYAIQHGYPVASVKNDTGAYVQPSDTAVATALSYATQQPDGTHVLNFAPGDAAAYNPSTYSYLLLRIGGSADASKGSALTQFAEYALTIGQAGADKIGYASIGRNLIQFGLNRIQIVPGYVAPTQTELNAVPQTQQVAQHAPSLAGGASATGGGGSSSGGGGSGGASSASSSGSGTSGYSGSGASTAGARTASSTSSGASGSGGGGSTGGATAANASVSLSSPTGPLGRTGVESDILVSLGLALLVLGELWRRSARRTRES